MYTCRESAPTKSDVMHALGDTGVSAVVGKLEVSNRLHLNKM